MFRFLVFFVLGLLFSGAAHAQADTWEVSANDKSSIGIIEVRIGNAGSDLSLLEPTEKATGFIISNAGHVLTAGHVFTPEDYAICARASNADLTKSCRITFLWRGDRAQTFELTLASSRRDDRDYVVLKLPNAREKIGTDAWPKVTLAKQTVASEVIYALGYVGSDDASVGGENRLDMDRGTLRSDSAGDCGRSYGVARNVSAMTSPGLSGGPVYNDLHRVVGIVLGASCNVGDVGNVLDAPKSRVLLISDMIGLCNNPGFSCFFGWAGDIEKSSNDAPSPWYKRLVGGEQTADKLIYGWKLREVAGMTNYFPIFGIMDLDTELVAQVEKDAEAGSQLAILYQAVWALYSPLATPTEREKPFERLQALADAGYEPAQYLISVKIWANMPASVVSRRFATSPLTLNASNREQLAVIEKYLRSSAKNGWPAASASMFDNCRMRIFNCSDLEIDAFLTDAIAENQVDAMRVAAVGYLIGDNPEMSQKMGFSRPKDVAEALRLLHLAATPRSNASRNRYLFFYDTYSSAILAYFYWGGTYQGQIIIQKNPKQAEVYYSQCMGGNVLGANLAEFCNLTKEVGQFNTAAFPAAKGLSWANIKMLSISSPNLGPLAQNILTWSKDGEDITWISCELSDDLKYTPPYVTPTFRPGTAYCYFANPDSGY